MRALGSARGLFGACAYGSIVVVSTVLAVGAARADLARPRASSWETVTDVGVGIALCAGALLAPHTILTRPWFGLAGASWLLASIPSTSGAVAQRLALLVQASLLVALLSMPKRRPQGAVGLLLGAATVPVVALAVPHEYMAALFAVAVVAVLIPVPRTLTRTWYPAVCATAMTMVLAASWWVSMGNGAGVRRSDILDAYELVCAAIGLGFAAVARLGDVRSARVTTDLLATAGESGIAGVTAVLREVLRDPALVIEQAGHDSAVAGSSSDRERLVLEREGAVIGTVVHVRGALDDPVTAAAVSSTVRLALENEELQRSLDARVVELEAARRRSLDVVDRQRAVTATRLREEVVAPIERAVFVLRSAAPVDSDAAVAVGLAADELDAATGDVLAVIADAPPFELGGGRLVEAVRAMAQRCPFPVSVSVSSVTGSDPAAEAALYHVCSEAITNTIKHAGATAITIDLRWDPVGAHAVIRDDGVGGADPCGTGLQGLLDRLEPVSGRLRVDSPHGAGTTVTAVVPLSRSAATG